MKKIRRLLLGCLAFLVAFCSGFGFVGAKCESFKADQYGFLSQEVLTQKRIPDFPQLPHGEHTRTSDVRFYATITYGEFEAYVEEVYDYLSSCEFNYLCYGTNGRWSGLVKIGKEWKDFIFLEENGETTATFIWTDTISGQRLSDWDRVIIYYSPSAKILDHGKFKGFSYNFEISLKEYYLDNSYDLTEE
ncbi:MAG: hypothetical protein IJ506_03620 [Clostridia bacterium]|nr:hypothetical protein [Clostridia bacterium]